MMLSCTLDIKVACLILIFNFVLIFHAYTEPCETSKMELFVKIVNNFKLSMSWIHLCRSSHLTSVLENRCSEICSQNPWKIPVKKFIFSNVAGWQSATFSHVPWGFYQIKKFVKIVFFAGFFLSKNFQERDCTNLLKTNFFKDICQWFWLKIFPGNF